LAVQVHTTTHYRFIENSIEIHAGVIYSRLFKYTQQHTRFIENSIAFHAGVIYSWLFKYTQQHTAG
jgi:energy-converting hydrogenase Eha subunit F